MPTVTLNKTVFEQLLGRELLLEELKDRISMLGTDLESIEGDEIVVEVFPNRPDLLSEQGFARALSSFIGEKIGLRKYEVKKSGCKVVVDPSTTMRPFTVCAIVKNLNLNEEKIRELMQIQEKLATTHGRNRRKSAYGIYPLKEIHFPVKYVAKDPKEVRFTPLGFEEEICAADIEELHPKAKEYKEVAKDWAKYPFFIDAKDNVMCMLPYTNSNDTGKVDVDTKEVFIECTGVDLNNIKVALNIFVTMFADMGGEIESCEMEYETGTITTPDLGPKKMKLDLEYVNSRLGLELSVDEAKKLLERMGYSFVDGSVLIPAYRADVLHQVDLMEDIAIAYGYENFKEIIPNVATIGEESGVEKFKRKLREILLGLELLEVSNYHLMQEEELNVMMNQEGLGIGLLNALGEHNHLRNSILPSLMKNLRENQHHEYPQNLFELGRVFFKGESETGIVESESLGIVLCFEKTDFTRIRQVLDSIVRGLGFEASVKECSDTRFIAGRAGEVFVNDTKMGVIGEINPEVLETWGIVVPTVTMELDVEKLFELIND
jgi:phenylalanyl-tRNA synthetase beta chain